ncbi:hypothetical protein THPR109532_15430 [Thalassospira profundimaris]|nr:hypothetical protein TH2_10909 [Thalassospira profundimaris WP0211]
MSQDLKATSLEGTLAFCRMAIRSGALFNGGALVALIPLAANEHSRISSFDPIKRLFESALIDGLVTSGYWFIAGLFVSGLTGLIAFFGEFYYTNFHLTSDQSSKRTARIILIVGTLTVTSSLAFFGFGAYSAISSFRSPGSL